MPTSPLAALVRQGQSVWLDYIRRSLIAEGELRRLVDEDGVTGVTSNPAIFEKAIDGSTDYAEAIAALARAGETDAKRAYETLAIRDIQDAADVLRPVYERTGRRDGFVSMEVSPALAHDTQGTLAEARRLWAAVARPNLMIKVPGTPAGMPAIRELIGEGINVNVTLLFAIEAYVAAAEAYLAGLETLAGRGRDPGAVASVASFFVSRIDTAVDALVAQRLETADASARSRLEALRGAVAIANARLAYARAKGIYQGPRWQALAARGAHPQRLLWASTSTKDPRYRDVLYVEELIGPETVNTIPPETLAAFRDHGRVRPTLEADLSGARATMAALAAAGISMTEVTDALLADGVRKFLEPFEKLLAAVARRLAAAGAAAAGGQAELRS